MIPETEPVKNHYGNNVATQFDFDFYIEDATQLSVVHTDLSDVVTTLTYGVDYSIHEFGNKNGSYIVFPIQGSSYSTLGWDTSTNKKEILSIALSLPISQEAQYENSSKLNLSMLEYSLDYLTRLIQIINRQVVRAAKVPEGSDIDADDLTVNIIKVGESIDNVDTVAGDITNIDAVAANKTNIDNVAGSIDNVDAVGQSIGNVNLVSSDLTNINTVAGSITNVGKVADDITSVNQVGTNINNVVNVGADITNVDTVANNLTNIDTVAENIINVNNVGVSITKVNAVADDLDNIDDVIDNLDAINAAPQYAEDAQDSANAAIAAAESVKCGGQIWVAIDEDDWDLNSTTGKYEYEVDATKTPAIVGVYKGDWYDKKFVEVDIVSVDGHTYLVSPDAFDGLILGSLTLLNDDVEDTVATEQAAIALAAAEDATDAKNAILNDAGYIAVVAGLTNINAVAADLTNIDAVNTNKTNIDNVASDLTNINAVAADLTNIDNVASDLTNIDAVNANKTNIDTVAGGITNIGTVAGDIANVNSVAGDLTSIAAVKNNSTNINSVAGDLTNINAVANDLTNIDAVAADLANIDAIAGNFTKHYEFSNTALTPVNGKCTWNITHIINSTQVMCTLIEAATGKEVQRDFKINSSTSVTVEFLADAAVAANTYKAILIGG